MENNNKSSIVNNNSKTVPIPQNCDGLTYNQLYGEDKRGRDARDTMGDEVAGQLERREEFFKKELPRMRSEIGRRGFKRAFDCYE